MTDLRGLVEAAFSELERSRRRTETALDRCGQAARDLSAAETELTAAERREAQAQAFLETVWEHLRADLESAAGVKP